MYTPTPAKAGAVSAEAKIKLAIHLVFIVLSPYSDLTYSANPASAERFRPSFLPFSVFVPGNPLVHVPMAAHPLDTLGFEPIAFSAQKNPRSLADLGFETVTDTIGAHATAAARKTARDRVCWPACSK